MAFNKINATRGRAYFADPDTVTASCIRQKNGSGVTGSPRLTIYIPEKIGRKISLVSGINVSFHVGDGEHIGWIAIAVDPQGMNRLSASTSGGRLSTSTSQIDGLKEHKGCACEHRIEDGMLLVRVPALAPALAEAS